MKNALVKAVASFVIFTGVLFCLVSVGNNVTDRFSARGPKPVLQDALDGIEVAFIAYIAALMGLGYFVAALMSARACRRLTWLRLLVAALLAALGGVVVIVSLESELASELLEAILGVVTPEFDWMLFLITGLGLGVVSFRVAAWPRKTPSSIVPGPDTPS